MLRRRMLSAAILVPPLVVALLVGVPAVATVLALAAILAAREAFALLASAGHDSIPPAGAVLAVALVIAAAVRPAAEAGIAVVAIGAIVTGAWAFRRRDPREGLAAWATTVFGGLYVGLLAFVLHAGGAAPPVAPDAALAALGRDRGWILLLVLGVWTFDTGAYLVGRAVGRRRFLTHISPSKTLEGVAGGLVATTLVTAMMLGALGQAPLGALLLGPLLGLAAQAGDLAESMLKRAAGAKDSGTLIPGHGGILDRVDSFLFAAPVVTLYALAIAR